MKLSSSVLLLSLLGVTLIAIAHGTSSSVDDSYQQRYQGDLTAELNQCLPRSCVSSGCCSGNCDYWCRVCGISYVC
ncbi:hypothetical protein INT45_002045 [Circinella minor]|uniref:Uncharacterized protein n=1 Tax=Circinella minor TaxID=1195481 RepID=A0A8H7SEG5_9FUNG|nr:hypothetical protein INT45_002045 [Circinella minor]